MLQNLVIGREDYMRRCGDREDNQEIEYACMIKCFIVCLGRKIRMVYYVSWRRRWYRTPVLLPGKSHGQRSLVGCSPWGREELDRLSDFMFTFHFHALEKEMATHSSVLAWRIPGMVKPGGLPSMGLHRVGHD